MGTPLQANFGFSVGKRMFEVAEGETRLSNQTGLALDLRELLFAIDEFSARCRRREHPRADV